MIFLFSGGWLTKVPTLGLKSEAPGFKLPFGRLLACSFVDLKMEFFLRINWNCELGVGFSKDDLEFFTGTDDAAIHHFR